MTKSTEYQGPLAGLNVIDFGHYYAGPMAAMLLADQGANVIRIVKPGKKELPEQQYRLLNRNKKLLELDLKTPKGKSQAESLIEKADVLIENFRPGVMKRLGLDYASVKDKNPGLVYLSLPGFASTDKERAHIQAWEGVMNAAAGGFTETHWWRQLAGYPPVYTSVPMCSAHASMQGANAVMAALIAREEHACGSMIEVPQVAAATFGYLMGFVSRQSEIDPALSSVGKGIPAFMKPSAYCPTDSEEAQLDKLSLPHQSFLGPFMRWYPCSDTRDLMLWIQSTAALDKFLCVLGIDKKIKQEGYINEGPWVVGLDNNLNTLSTEHTQHIQKFVSEALTSKPAAEWESILGAANVAVAVIRTRDEWMSLDSAHKSGVFTQMGDLTVPGQFADVSGPEEVLVSNEFTEPESITKEDAEKLFAQPSPKETAHYNYTPLKKGELLKGLKVLDLCNLVAGPTATYTLAQYGAEVIKADPPRFAHPALLSSSMLEVNQGKRSILTDLTTQPGREIFERLVLWADIVVHNSVDGVAERLGVTKTQLQKINPDVAICQFSFLGGIYRGNGGSEHYPGFDSLIQGVGGIMAHYGSIEKPQFHGQIICGDIMGGIGGAFAALLAVYQKRKTGVAGEARCSLARMINYIQLPHMIARNGNSDWGEAHGQFTLGESWWQRLYQCSDRWIYVETTKDRAYLLTETVAGLPGGNEDALKSAFSKKDYKYWLAKLNEAQIACHLVANVDDICAQGIHSVVNEVADERAEGTVEVIVRNTHPAGKPIVNLAPTWVRVGEDHNYRRLTPAMRYGEHTKDILKELGYFETEIEELIRLKVAHEYLPAMGGKYYFFNPEKQH